VGWNKEFFSFFSPSDVVDNQVSVGAPFFAKQPQIHKRVTLIAINTQ
jgi:hypothetical protein